MFKTIHLFVNPFFVPGREALLNFIGGRMAHPDFSGLLYIISSLSFNHVLQKASYVPMGLIKIFF